MQSPITALHLTAMAATGSADPSTGARKRAPRRTSKASGSETTSRKRGGAKSGSSKASSRKTTKKTTAKKTTAKKASPRRRGRASAPAEVKPGLLRRAWRLRGWLMVATALGLMAAASCHVHTAAATHLSRSLEAGTLVLIDRLSPEVASTPTGSVVLVRSSQDRARRVLGRILARGGDEVEWRAGALRVNGEETALPARLAADAPPAGRRGVRLGEGRRRLKRRPFPAALGLERVPQEVPRHHVYVLVDAEGGAIRGRLVPEGDVVGIARVALTNLEAEVAWLQRLPRPIR